mgnify:CR=1 FL=1
MSSIDIRLVGITDLDTDCVVNAANSRLAMGSGVCGAISMLMWWFEMNGLMATEAARPFTFACGCIGCFGGGMSFKK